MDKKQTKDVRGATIFEFRDLVRETIIEFLPEYPGIRISDVSKKNTNVGELIGLSFLKQGENIGLAVYLEGFFQKMQFGVSMAQILKEIADQVRTPIPDGLPQDVTSSIYDYQEARMRVRSKIIRAEGNEAMLIEVPHRLLLDLAELFYLDYDFGTIRITNEMARKWNMTAEDLHRDAFENVKDDVIYRGLYDFLAECCIGLPGQDSETPKIMLLTTKQGYFGAGLIADNNVLEMISEGEDIWIIPSSVHEVLIIPKSAVRAEDLKMMIKEVNITQVAPDEVLSNHLYEFSISDKMLKIVSDSE